MDFQIAYMLLESMKPVWYNTIKSDRRKCINFVIIFVGIRRCNVTVNGWVAINQNWLQLIEGTSRSGFMIPWVYYFGEKDHTILNYL